MVINSRNSRGRSKIWILPVLLIILAAAIGIYRINQTKESVVEVSPSPTPDYNPKILTVGIDSRPTGILFYALSYYIPRTRFYVKPVLIEDPNERFLRLAAGDLDLTVSTLPEFVLGAARHHPGAMIGFISTSRGCDGIVSREFMDSPEQLVGKKITAVPGSNGHYLLVKLLDSIARSTAEIQFIPASDSATALNFFTESNYVDAAALQQFELDRAIDDGGYLVVSTERRFAIKEVLVASNFCLKHRKKDVQQVVNAYFQLVNFIDKNPGLARKLILSRSGRSIEEVETLLESCDLMQLDRARLFSRERIAAAIKKIQQVWTIEGLPNADGKIDFQKSIDLEFLEKASIVREGPLFESSPPPRETKLTVEDESPTPGASPTSPKPDILEENGDEVDSGFPTRLPEDTSIPSPSP